MKTLNLTGLISATHTAFHADGSLNVDAVEQQAAHLLNVGIRTVFIGGSTGECASLSLEERLRLAERWLEVSRGSGLRVVVHVGSNCLDDAAALARQAQKLGALAVAAVAPSYFKPSCVDILVECAACVARAAPDVPFYFYDIPVLTGVHLSMPEFLEKGRERIVNLAGIKYSNPDLIALQECLRVAGGAFDVFWGTDESLLAALALGVKGAVGNTYNMAAPVGHQLLRAFGERDLDAARAAQGRLLGLVQVLKQYGYIPGSKALMNMLGIDLGPPRLPLQRLAEEQVARLRTQLGEIGYFDWL